MSRKIKFATDEYYHLYSRGTDKREIFCDNYDYDRFLKFLYLANTSAPVNLRDSLLNAFNTKHDDTLVDIGAYCLMPNHFHILVREHTENGISNFMKKLLTSHSTFFNKKYKRTGALFESRFKARLADSDEYLKYLFAYIHLNPVKLIEPKWKDDGICDPEKALTYLRGYTHSSYIDYIEATRSRREQKILNKIVFPDYFEESGDFGKMVNDWLTYKEL